MKLKIGNVVETIDGKMIVLANRVQGGWSFHEFGNPMNVGKIKRKEIKLG